MNRKAKAIQIWGTGSGVGKSVITAALCRIFLQDGFRVSPFKAQNMALNSFVTKDGDEIGRAQAVQAQAARITPTVDMNPILLKPTADRIAQVIIKGRPLANMSALEYTKYKRKAFDTVKESYSKLVSDYDIVIIEGAGSPAEINLRQHDIVNLKMAEFANCPVILVGDIDKGGVFAWLIGTLQLLNKKERTRVKGFIINKFRGDIRLLKSGLDFLEAKTNKKVLGVIPYFRDILIPEEDSVPLEKRQQRLDKSQQKINIGVIHLPHISNFTDFDALGQEEDVGLRYIKNANELNGVDVVVIPGSKSTISDLTYLNKSGFAARIKSIMMNGNHTTLIGICGGYQMLGRQIIDSQQIESQHSKIQGLGLLPIKTIFRNTKSLSHIEAIELSSHYKIKGYEIHHGQSFILNNVKPLFKINKSNGSKVSRLDGVISSDARIWGTYIHGIFDNDIFRRNFLNKIRLRKGWQPIENRSKFNIEEEFDKLAALVRKNTDMEFLYKILGLKN